MKNAYQRLSKEEKRKIKIEYKKTEKGRELNIRLIRLTILGGLGILFGAWMIFETIVNKASVWNYILYGMLIAFCIFFSIQSVLIRGKAYNRYVLDTSKVKSKKKK